jgi:hypothetical protein
MCESQSEKAFNEKLIRSRWVSGQVPQVSLQPMPFVPPPKKVLSAKGKRKRQILRIVATHSALVGFVLIMSPFVASGLAAVPGAHVDDVDSFSWFCIAPLFFYVPVGLIFVLLAGGLLVTRSSLR